MAEMKCQHTLADSGQYGRALSISVSALEGLVKSVLINLDSFAGIRDEYLFPKGHNRIGQMRPAKTKDAIKRILHETIGLRPIFKESERDVVEDILEGRNSMAHLDLDMPAGDLYSGKTYELWRASQALFEFLMLFLWGANRIPNRTLLPKAEILGQDAFANERAGEIVFEFVLLRDAAPGMPRENIKPAVLALFDVGDKLEVSSLTDNQLLAAAGVVNRLLTPLNEPARLNILLEAAETSVSLGAMVYFTSLYGKDSEGGKTLLNESGWNDIRDELVARIRTAAEEMSLARSPHFAILLYRWKEWAPPEDSRRFVKLLTESDDGVLVFLQGMVARTSSTAGRYASRNGWYFPIDGVKEFIDPKALVEPLQRMRSDRWADMTDFQREATDAFFSAHSKTHETT